MAKPNTFDLLQLGPVVARSYDHSAASSVVLIENKGHPEGHVLAFVLTAQELRGLAIQAAALGIDDAPLHEAALAIDYASAVPDSMIAVAMEGHGGPFGEERDHSVRVISARMAVASHNPRVRGHKIAGASL